MLLVAAASGKLADAVLSILIEWPGTTFGTTTRRLAQLCPDGRRLFP